MPVDYAENPGRFRGSGTVFIAREAGSLRGYWDALPDADPAALEQLPDGLTLIEAVQWGIERAPRTLVRTEQSGYYLVGAGESVELPSDIEVEGPISLEDLADL